jgi:hypothetical protein
VVNPPFLPTKKSHGAFMLKGMDPLNPCPVVILLFAQLFFIHRPLAMIKFPQFSPSTIHCRHQYLHNMNLLTVATALTDASLSPPPSPPPDGPSDMLDVMISVCSAAVWDTEKLRPTQQKIIRLMFNPDKPNKVLAIYRTGKGKSHVIRMVGVLDCGVCMIFMKRAHTIERKRAKALFVQKNPGTLISSFS